MSKKLNYNSKISVLINKSKKADAKQSAKASHISLAQFVRNAIDHYIKWIRGE